MPNERYVNIFFFRIWQKSQGWSILKLLFAKAKERKLWSPVFIPLIQVQCKRWGVEESTQRRLDATSLLEHKRKKNHRSVQLQELASDLSRLNWKGERLRSVEAQDIATEWVPSYCPFCSPLPLSVFFSVQLVSTARPISALSSGTLSLLVTSFNLYSYILRSWPRDTLLFTKTVTKILRREAVAQSVYFACWIKATEFISTGELTR
jgi:hypothetical protein